MGSVGISTAWGGDLGLLGAFNEHVLPASMKWGGGMLKSEHVKFVHLWGNAAKGDQLLQQHIPLVVGVSLHGTGTRDHFIAVVMDGANNVWAIDSWGNWTGGSVVQLPSQCRSTHRRRTTGSQEGEFGTPLARLPGTTIAPPRGHAGIIDALQIGSSRGGLGRTREPRPDVRCCESACQLNHTAGCQRSPTW